ncbi:hypothetical protein [Streptomyces pini]|uniref:Phosphatidate cytidylyltransferase n=1 Tax=Streptomyces pini TaxID=1520580 RepID=A0A1I4MEA9_9ACTN|nr:hypothetical protein [Streptomyces pini]SFM01520.1 hypothetical protein SAMN05192584_1405 [Streptomyces pini]
MDDRTRLTTAALGAALAVLVAAEHPGMLPALTFGLLVWGALALLLRL